MLVTTILLTVSIATAITPTDSKKQKGESPLYKIRKDNAISRSIQKIKTKFFGERIFFIPLIINNYKLNLKNNLYNKEFTEDSFTCVATGYCTCIVTSGCSEQLPTCKGNTCDNCHTWQDTCEYTCRFTCK